MSNKRKDLIKENDLVFTHRNQDLVIGFGYNEEFESIDFRLGLNNGDGTFDGKHVWGVTASESLLTKDYIRKFVLPLMNEKIQTNYGMFAKSDRTPLQDLSERVARFCKENMVFNPETGFSI